MFGWLFGKPKRRPRRRRLTDKQRANRERAAMDRQAAAWVRTDNRRREREQAREKRQNERRVRHDMMAAGRADSSYRRQKASLRKQGWASHEIDELLHGLSDDRLGERNPRLVLAMDFLEGRGEHARSNPSCTACRRNPSAMESAAQFHGRSGPGFTSGRKVVLGELTRLNYRPPPGSDRGGSEWTHESGDRGLPFLKNRGRGRVLGDPNTGAVTVEMRGSGMRYEAGRGLVG